MTTPGTPQWWTDYRDRIETLSQQVYHARMELLDPQAPQSPGDLLGLLTGASQLLEMAVDCCPEVPA